MMKFGLRIVLFPYLCFFPILVHCQYEVSRKKEYSKQVLTPSARVSDEDHQQIFDQIDLANSFVQTDPQAALLHIEKALELSYRCKNQRGEGYSFHSLGVVNFHLGKFESSVRYYEKALAIFQSIGETQVIPTACRNLGMAFEVSGNSKEAERYYLRFLDEAGKAADKDGIREVKEILSRIAEENREYEKALKFHKDLLSDGLAAGLEDQVFGSYSNIARISLLMGDTATALSYYDLSQKQARDNKNPSNEAKYYSNISDYYEQQQDYPQQLVYEKKALERNIAAGNREGTNFSQIKVADILIRQDSAAKAIPYLVNSIAISEELGTIENQKEAYGKLATAYEKVGNYEGALENYKRYLEIADSLQNERARETIEALKMERVILERETEIKKLEDERLSSSAKILSLEQADQIKEEGLRRQRIINYTLFGSLLLVIFSSVLIWRSSRQKRRANQLLALRSLRSQMNPHFIFNSLNSVNSFIAKNDERSANKYLSEFSRLMRAVLENSKHDFVTLAGEVEILRLYLGLEHFRFQDKFEYEFNVDSEIDMDQIQIPPMLVQPFIENAVWHGLRYKENKGFLKVDIVKSGKVLKVTIADNGIGREKSRELKTVNQMKQESTGMRNIQSRIDIINEVHGSKYKVNIKDLENDGFAAGTLVELEIPVVST